MTKEAHNESFYGIGTVTIRPFKLVDGRKVYEPEDMSKHNLIVRRGRETLMDLLLGLTSKKLRYIRWGKGGAPSFPDGDPLTPNDVEDLDIDVGHFLLDKELNQPDRISPTICAFTETLICDEVDDDVNEAAMMYEDPTTLERSIFARITFPTARLTVEKGSGLDIEWTFNFNNVKEEL